MTYYETMYIVHPALEAGRLKDLILSVEKSMHNLGGETCALNVWGKKKLAYAINKEKYGMYVLFQFKNNGESNKDFNLGLEHNTDVLAYLTTKINQDSILSDLPDLDTQLGLSSKNNNSTIEEESDLIEKSDTPSASKTDDSSIENKEDE